MTKQVVHVEPLQTVENSMALLCEKRFRHLPELTQGNLVGVLFVSDQRYTISQLESYIGQ